jgi:hypothetical protein
MTEETSFEMFDFEGLFEKGVFAEVEHAKAKVHACSKVSIHLANVLSTEGFALNS